MGLRRVELKKAAEHRANCDKEIDLAHETICKNQEEYDKQLLTLSSGFLLLSLAFIKDIVHTNDAIYRGLLYGSFVSLLVCIIVVLFSFQMSNAGHAKAQLYWENQRDSDGKIPFPYGHAKVITWLNRFSGLIFVVGILLSMSFVITNINHEASMNDQRKGTNDGAPMRIPMPEKVEKGQPMKVPPPPPPKQSTPPSPPKK
jgi:hypothetical protein